MAHCYVSHTSLTVATAGATVAGQRRRRRHRQKQQVAAADLERRRKWRRRNNDVKNRNKIRITFLLFPLLQFSPTATLDGILTTYEYYYYYVSVAATSTIYHITTNQLESVTNYNVQVLCTHTHFTLLTDRRRKIQFCFRYSFLLRAISVSL